MRRLGRLCLAAAVYWICAVTANEEPAQMTTEALRTTNDFVRSHQNEAQTSTEPPNMSSDPPYVLNRANFDEDFNSTFDDYNEISTEETSTIFSEQSYNETDSERLFAATEVAATGIYPYALHILSTVPEGTRACTATLITADYAITAASCVYDATTITVRAATLDGTDGTAITGTAIVHPKYTRNTYDYDIALIKLLTPYTISATIAPINIAYKFNIYESKDLTGKSMRVIAFGDVTANSATYVLNEQSMRVLSRSRCFTEMRKRNIKPATFQDCLDTDSGLLGGCNPADIGGAVTYKFDSGSTYTLVGVLNYYHTCASSTPNLFTRIGPYLDLIRKYVPTYANIG